MTNRRVASFLEHFTQQHIMNCSVCKKALYPTKQSFAYRCIQCPDFVLCQTCELECHEHHPVYHSFLILRKSLFGKKLSHFPNVSKDIVSIPKPKHDIGCSECPMKKIIGIRYQCANCPCYNLCQFDYDNLYKEKHRHDHAFIKIRSLFSLINEVFYELELDTSWFKSGNEQDSLVSSSPMSQHQTITTPQKEIPSSTSSPPSSPSSTTATYPPEKDPMKLTRGYSADLSTKKQIRSKDAPSSSAGSKQSPTTTTTTTTKTKTETETKTTEMKRTQSSTANYVTALPKSTSNKKLTKTSETPVKSGIKNSNTSTEEKKKTSHSQTSSKTENTKKDVDNKKQTSSLSHSFKTKSSPSISSSLSRASSSRPSSNISPKSSKQLSKNTTANSKSSKTSASTVSSSTTKTASQSVTHKQSESKSVKQSKSPLPHETVTAYSQTNDLFDEIQTPSKTQIEEKKSTSPALTTKETKTSSNQKQAKTDSNPSNYITEVPTPKELDDVYAEDADDNTEKTSALINYKKDGFGTIVRSNLYIAYTQSYASSVTQKSSKAQYETAAAYVVKDGDEGPSSLSSVSSTSEDSTKNEKKLQLTTDLMQTSGPVRNWSTIITQLTEEKERAKTSNELYAVFTKYQQIATEFKEAASTIAKTIIDEAYLPIEKKTIKPIDAGGIAGGQKFLHDGIFLKFAIDLHGVYGGDVGASKAASRELQGLKAYFKARIEDLYVPFMVLIDYRGFRMIATPCLPIGKGTLMYGSDDGGQTIIKKDKLLNRMMKMAAKEIGLKAHLVGLRQPSKIYGPADIEGHRGTDGRYYVIDTARVLPPFPPNKTITAFVIPKDPPTHQLWANLSPIQVIDLPLKGWRNHVKKHFSVELQTNGLQEDFSSGFFVFSVPFKNENGLILNRRATAIVHKEVYGDVLLVPIYRMRGMQLIDLIRYEYVQKCKENNIFLSSDAFTFFQVPGPEKDADEETIRTVTNKLVNEEIPNFCKKLLRGEIQIKDGPSLVESMHQHGINLKFLGLVRLQVKENPKLDSVVLSEMVARATKGFLRSVLRRVKPAELDISCKIAVVSYFNLVLGDNSAAQYYWRTFLKPLVITRFGKCLTEEEMNSHYDLRTIIHDKFVLLTTLAQQVGVVFPEEQIESLRKDPTKFQTKWPIDVDKASQIRLVAYARSWGDSCIQEVTTHLKQVIDSGGGDVPPTDWKCPRTKKVIFKSSK